MMVAVNVANFLMAADESPSLKPGLDANQVSPGVIGFLITLLLAVLIILVGLDHTRRQRRLKNRFDYAMAREEERREAEQADGPSEDLADAGHDSVQARTNVNGTPGVDPERR
ncbi:hypothetical protein [uncultured Kocuria sp.]|uniref:hypothetical protein n=1 Tax=uncultured Kocuria sp. TaxID=259305 RepID=UPI002594184D|nr:hypothetical protein [uncultured Kocuria sp.]MCT1366477.1 hypothetical protein [Rothia sp. p3-SID1597]